MQQSADYARQEITELKFAGDKLYLCNKKKKKKNHRNSTVMTTQEKYKVAILMVNKIFCTTTNKRHITQ